MRFALATITLLGAVASASASLVSRQSIPECAVACIADTSNDDGCGAADTACKCQSSVYIGAATSCITSTCQGEEIAAALAFAQTLCASFGVTLSVPTSASTSASSTTSATSASTTGGSTTGTSTATAPTSSNTTPTSSSPSPSASSIQTGAASAANLNSALAGIAAVGIAALAL